MDFGGWVPEPNFTVTVTPQAGQTQTDMGQQPPPPTPSAPGSNSGDGSVFSHQLEHPGVVCDVCNAGIAGFRYKCLKCVDYDLCSTCERRGYHAGHVMMRIPFPEMAAEAIKRYVGPAVSPDMSFPFGQFYQHFSRGEHEHRADHCRGRGTRRRHSQSHSSPESADETKQPVPPGWCPYKLGRKELKKLAKNLKKTRVDKRKAEACSSNACGGSGTNPSAETQTAGATKAPLDLTAAAVQIQEVLNAFGLPIDVVSLYDSWGVGQGTSAPAATESTNAAAGSGNEASQAEATACPLAPETAATSSQEITEQFQELNIRNEASSTLPLDVSDSGSGSLSQDLIHLISGTATRSPQEDGDSGWTVIDNNESVGRAGDNATAGVALLPQNVMIDGNVFRQIPIVTEAVPTHFEAPPVSVAQPVTVPAAIIASPPPTAIASAPAQTVTSPSQVATKPSAPPTSQPQAMYPQLPQALAPMVTGFTNAVGNVTRNIPIALQWQQPARGPQQAHAPTPLPLDEPMAQVLQQLLSMGFSNHNGDLAKLVREKNGNMEDILNALFPRPR